MNINRNQSIGGNSRSQSPGSGGRLSPRKPSLASVMSFNRNMRGGSISRSGGSDGGMYSVNAPNDVNRVVVDS